MTDNANIADLNAKLTKARDGVETLGNRLAELDEQLEAASRDGPAHAFAAYLDTGDVTADPATAFTAERERTADLLAAGKRRVDGLANRIRQAEKELIQARIVAMTMPDAIEHARDVLGSIDAEKAGRDLDRLEREHAALDAPRFAARDAYQAARDTATNVAMRYRGAADPRAGKTLEDYRQTETEARYQCDRLEDNARDLAVTFDQRRAKLRREVTGAFAHLARLAAVEAGKADAHAKAVGTFARSLATPGGAAPVPEPVALDLPDAAVMGELIELAAPALAVASRRFNRARPDSDYLPRSINHLR